MTRSKIKKRQSASESICAGSREDDILQEKDFCRQDLADIVVPHNDWFSCSLTHDKELTLPMFPRSVLLSFVL